MNNTHGSNFGPLFSACYRFSFGDGLFSLSLTFFCSVSGFDYISVDCAYTVIKRHFCVANMIQDICSTLL